jgi:hypothetical protein
MSVTPRWCAGEGRILQGERIAAFVQMQAYGNAVKSALPRHVEAPPTHHSRK